MICICRSFSASVSVSAEKKASESENTVFSSPVLGMGLPPLLRRRWQPGRHIPGSISPAVFSYILRYSPAVSSMRWLRSSSCRNHAFG